MGSMMMAGKHKGRYCFMTSQSYWGREIMPRKTRIDAAGALHHIIVSVSRLALRSMSGDVGVHGIVKW